MNENYIETMALRTCHCDMHGDWRPGAILEAMQETATAHCDRLGLSREVTDALGVAWVLSRCHVALKRLPRRGETISVETYPQAPRHLFYPRVNVFRDGEGREIGGAGSLWVLLDLRTRRITDSEAVKSRLPDNRDRDAGPRVSAAVRPLAAEPVCGEYMPAYTDFDINGHANNTRYLDWCCNALGFETMADARLVDFEISYESEILPGTRIRTELARQEDRFTFFGCAGERRCFAVAGTLRPRSTP